jgi:autotransporter-associated beta strand protein
MKPKSTTRNLLAVAASSLMAVSSASAQSTLYWDGGAVDIPTDGNGASGGTAGTWDTTLLNWDAGVSPHVAWDNTDTLENPADIAVFGGTAGTVTLGTGITAGGLTFNINNYIITGGTLTLAGASTPIINVTTGGSTISSQISGSNGLQKNGTGVLLLNGTSDYIGGTLITAGRLNATSDAALGNSAGSITLNGGTLGANNTTGTARQGGVNLTSARDVIVGASGGSIFVSKNNNFSTTGALSGSGTFTTVDPGGGGGTPIYRFSSNANTFTGAMSLRMADLRVSSLGDTAGNNIVFAGTGSIFRLNDTGATAGLTFTNRAFELSNMSAEIGNLNTTHALTINSHLLATGDAAKTLALTAAAGPTNVFAGNIVDATDAGAGTVALSKSGAGTWTLSGTNTYSGTTTLGFANPGNGFLVFQGIQALSSNTSIVQTHSGGTGAHNTLKILDDSATPASRSGVNLTFNHSNNSKNTLSVFVGNNNTANGGTSSSTQTGSTIQLGNMNFNQTSTGQLLGTALSVTGADDYRLRLGDVNVSLMAAFAGNWGVELRAGNTLIIGGNVQQAAGSLGTTTLQLAGTASGNQILGAIRDSADETPQAMSLNKFNAANDWTLSGNNTYTGATTIQGGTLAIGGSGTLGHVSAGVGNYAGNVSIASANSGRLVYNSTASQTLGGVVSGAGALFVENGTLTLTNDNTYTGATTITASTLLVNGDSSAATGAVTVNSGATLGGSGTIGGASTVSGSIAPGTTGIDTLTVNNDVTWNAGNAWKFDLGAGNTSDKLSITGTGSDFLKGSGSGWIFDFFGSSTLGNFTLVTWAGTTDFAETDFTATNYAGPTGTFSISGNSLLFTAVPEPTSALAGLLLTAGLLRRRRRGERMKFEV